MVEFQLLHIFVLFLVFPGVFGAVYRGMGAVRGGMGTGNCIHVSFNDRVAP